MVELNMSEEDFKLLLTLCAHDFRHDFMNTSDRVHAGLIKGAKGVGGGGNGSKSKSNPKRKSKKGYKDNNVTHMGIIFNDIIFIKNLKEQEVKSKVGYDK